MIWFTADQHFGHENIIKYCDRPFYDVDLMDEAMIARWNKVVDKKDVVYHLGDFTLGDAAHALFYFMRLNGRIFVLNNRWHHDRRWLGGNIGAYEAVSVWMLPPIEVIEKPNTIVLCHYPIARWDRKHYGSWHLHGHTHNRYQGDGFCLDVGVDANDFYPISLDQVEATMRKKGWHEDWREFE